MVRGTERRWVSRWHSRVSDHQRHSPPPGLAFGEPDDRLRQGIRYAAASPLNHYCLGVLDRPVEPDDDSAYMVADMPSRAGFAAACALSGIYGLLQGAWPFGFVEIWTAVALRRWVKVRSSQ